MTIEMEDSHRVSDDNMFGDEDDLFRGDTFADEEIYRPLGPVYVESEPTIESLKDQQQDVSNHSSGPDLKAEVEHRGLSSQDSDDEDSSDEIPYHQHSTLDSDISSYKEESGSTRRLRSHQPVPANNDVPSVPRKRPSPSHTQGDRKHKKPSNSDALDSESDENYDARKSTKVTRKGSDIAFDQNAQSTRETRKHSTAKGGKVRQKIFNLIFLSKLDGTVDRAIQLKVLGKYDFSSILESVLEGFVKEFDVPHPEREQYTVDNVTLYWNGAKLLKFMTCDSLRVSNSDDSKMTEIEVTMVFKDQEQMFEDEERSKFTNAERKRYSERESVPTIDSDSNPPNADQMADCSLEILDVDESPQMSADEVGSKLVPIELDSGEETKVIRLALVSQDNTKLQVNVRRSTLLLKVADYYKLHKAIPKTADLKLIFDHEMLDLNETVGEQDLEDEDMLEVVINSLK